MDDRFSYWDVAREQIPLVYEDNRAFARLASEAGDAGDKLKLPDREYARAIHQLYEAYSSFLHALNPVASDPGSLAHWGNHYRDARLGKRLGEPPIYQEGLKESAYLYLKSDLRAPMLDRGLVDALIAQETLAYIDRHAGRGAFLTYFGCVGVWLIITALLSAFTHDVDWRRLGLVLAGVFAIGVVAWAWPKKGAYALHRAMKDTYQLLTGSVVSVSELRHRVNRARDRGVVWPPELYAVLDDIEARTKIL